MGLEWVDAICCAFVGWVSTPPDCAILVDVIGWQDKRDSSACLTAELHDRFCFHAETETRFCFLGLITTSAGRACGSGDGMGG